MPSNPLPELHCACASLRRAARLVTQLYSHEMSGGVEPSQFSLLSALSQRPGAGQAPLGRALGLDKTTMSRNLRLMEKNGWIELAVSGDRRARGYRLTASGERLLADMKPQWGRAQARLRAAFDPGEWEAMLKAFDRTAEAALVARHTEPRASGDA
jgi:DNA-binding MarR family transcriptional regulator